MLSQELELDYVNSRRKITVAVMFFMLLIAATTVSLGRPSHTSVKDYFSSSPSQNPHTYTAQLKRLKSFAQHVEERDGPDGSSSVIEIRDDDLKKFCYGEFDGMENQQKLGEQLYLEMQYGAMPQTSPVVSLTFRNKQNLLSVAADATSMTDFRQSVIFGGVGGTTFEWVPLQTFVNIRKSFASGAIGKFQFGAGTKDNMIDSPVFGTAGSLSTGYGGVYGCLGDIEIWSDTLVRGYKLKFCRGPPQSTSVGSGVMGFQTGTSAWAFGTDCSSCGSSGTARRCIVGVRGRSGALIDQISFVQACTDLW